MCKVFIVRSFISSPSVRCNRSLNRYKKHGVVGMKFIFCIDAFRFSIFKNYRDYFNPNVTNELIRPSGQFITLIRGLQGEYQWKNHCFIQILNFQLL